MGESLTGAGWYFSASHRDPVRKELHGHSYEVVCWWPAEPPRDAMVLQERVKTVLKASFDHKTLPDEITRAEDVGRAVGVLLDGCVRVNISRQSERLHAVVWL